MPLNFADRPLTPNEARVLGTLMEKDRTVPDSYPLTLNTLVLGCNQKTSRDPVMDLSDEQVQAALDSLRKLSLVTETSGSRVMRFGHNFRRAVNVSDAEFTALGLLLLRGPLTSAEIRTYGERWHKFADAGAVEVCLSDLTEWDEEDDVGRNPTKGPALVVQLARLPGHRESRWMHLLGGPVDAQLAVTPSDEPQVAATYRSLQARIEVLETEMQALKHHSEKIEKALNDQLGLTILP